MVSTTFTSKLLLLLFLPKQSHLEVAHAHKDTHDYEELYFVPASKEKELVTQIKKLGVAEISRANKSLRSEYQ